MKKFWAFLVLPLLFLTCGCHRRTTTQDPGTDTSKKTDTGDKPQPIENVTIYVSSDGVGTNDGSKPEEATTLYHALDIFNSGDKIILLSGTYNLNAEVTIDKQGSEEKRNELIGQGEVIFDFIDSKEDDIQTNGGINVLGSYWNIENINVCNSDYFGFTIRGSGCSLNNCISNDNCSGGFFINNASSTTVTNCIAYNNTYTGSSASGFYISGSGSNNVIESCVAYDNQDSGFVALSSKGVTFNKCIAIENGLVDLASQRSGFVFNNKGHEFTNCISYNNAYVGFLVPAAYQEKGSYKLDKCSAINNHNRNYYLRKNVNDEVSITDLLSFNNYDSNEDGTIDALKDMVLGNVSNSIFLYSNTDNSYNYVLADEDYSSLNIDTIIPLDLTGYTNEYKINTVIPETMKEYIDETEYIVKYYKDGSINLYDYLDRATLFQDELFTKLEIEEPSYFGANVNE